MVLRVNISLICSALRDNTGLRRLAISRNPWSVNSVRYMMTAIVESNETLFQLFLGKRKVMKQNFEVCKQLKKKLKHNRRTHPNGSALIPRQELKDIKSNTRLNPPVITQLPRDGVTKL